MKTVNPASPFRLVLGDILLVLALLLTADVLISSDYHMDRAVRTAESAGFSDVLRLPAPSSFRNFGANILSEVILELNELTLRKQVRRSDDGLPG